MCFVLNSSSIFLNSFVQLIPKVHKCTILLTTGKCIFDHGKSEIIFHSSIKTGGEGETSPWPGAKLHKILRKHLGLQFSAQEKGKESTSQLIYNFTQYLISWGGSGVCEIKVSKHFWVN